MNTIFKILWFEDEQTWYNMEKLRVEGILKTHYLIPEIVRKSGDDFNIDELIGNDFDLILMFIAILGSDRPLSGGTANNVQQFQLTKHSVEFYSNTLMSALADMIGTLDFRYSYRVSGEVDIANRVAYFSMKTLKKNERRSPINGQGVRSIED